MNIPKNKPIYLKEVINLNLLNSKYNESNS